MNSKNKGFQAKNYFGKKISHSRIYFYDKTIENRSLFIFSFFFLFSFFGKISTTSAQAVIDSTSNYNGYGVSCYGEADGWIAVSGTGGVLPYTYEWTKDGSPYGGNTPTITGLDNGYYGVNIFDDNGAFIGNVGAFIDQPTDLQTLTQIDLVYFGFATSCAGASDAKAWAYSWNGAVSVTTGVTPYVYTWSNGYIGDTLQNVGAGTYTVTTTDANGCSFVNSLDIIDPPTKSITITEDTPISCEGGSNGGITALLSNSNGSETFLWSNGETTATILGLSADTYTITATDINGCETIGTIDLADGPELDVIFGITPPSCGGSDGELIAIPTGGNPPYVSYNWNTGASTSSIDNLSEGIYTVTVYDQLGCNAEVTHELFSSNVFYTSLESDELLSTICPDPPSICTYSYSGGSCSNITVNTGQTFCINSGTFTCQINLNGGTVYVAEGATFAPINSNNYDGTIINCGTTNFSGQLFESGTQIHNYGDMAFPNMTANNTTVTNYLGGNMYFDNSVILTNNSIINNNGTLELNGNLTIQAGTINNYYDIFVNNTFIIETNNSSLNNSGRIAARRDIRINSGGTIINDCSLIALRDIIIDNGFTNNGLLYANSSGSEIRINGTASLINNGDFVTQSLINNADLEGSGNFWVFGFTQQNGSSIGVDGNGLNFYDATFDQNGNGNEIFDVESGTIDPSVTKNPPTGPLQDVNTIPDNCSSEFNATVCPGSVAASIRTNIFGGSPPYSYLWSTGETTPSISNVAPGTYTLTVTDVSTCDQVIEATVYTYDTIMIDSVVTQIDCIGTDGDIDLTISGGTAPYTFVWAHGPTSEDITNLSQGAYSVTITDDNNCSVDATFHILEPVCVEICGDGNDNDGDGDVDCNDTDCQPDVLPFLLTTCDNSNETGSGVFFLHDANSAVTTTSNVVISYHPNLTDAQNDINQLISPYTSSDGTVYARVENNVGGCFDTSLITLNVGAKCVESCVNKVDDDGDGLIDKQDSECSCSGN